MGHPQSLVPERLYTEVLDENSRLKALNAELLVVVKGWQHSHCRCSRCVKTRELIAKVEGDK